MRLAADFGFRPQGLVELGGLARQADPGPRGYIEKYFRVTNPDYVDRYLEELEKENMPNASKTATDDIQCDSEASPPTPPDAETVEKTTVPPPRKPGSMIALATITSMYTQRSLNKGPVRSSNWEKNPLSEEQLECTYYFILNYVF